MNPLHAELLRLRRRGERRVNRWAVARYLDHGIRTGVLAAAALFEDHGAGLQHDLPRALLHTVSRDADPHGPRRAPGGTAQIGQGGESCLIMTRHPDRSGDASPICGHPH